MQATLSLQKNATRQVDYLSFFTSRLIPQEQGNNTFNDWMIFINDRKLINYATTESAGWRLHTGTRADSTLTPATWRLFFRQIFQGYNDTNTSCCSIYYQLILVLIKTVKRVIVKLAVAATIWLSNVDVSKSSAQQSLPWFKINDTISVNLL